MINLLTMLIGIKMRSKNICTRHPIGRSRKYQECSELSPWRRRLHYLSPRTQAFPAWFLSHHPSPLPAIKNIPSPITLQSFQSPISPVDAGNRWDILLITDTFSQEPIPDLPGEHCRVLPLVFSDGVHYVRRRYLGLAATDDAGFEAARLEIPVGRNRGK